MQDRNEFIFWDKNIFDPKACFPGNILYMNCRICIEVRIDVARGYMTYKHVKYVRQRAAGNKLHIYVSLNYGRIPEEGRNAETIVISYRLPRLNHWYE